MNHGDVNTLVSVCPVLEPGGSFVPPAGTSLDGDDCDDADPNISPSAMASTPNIDFDGYPTFGVLPQDLPSWYPDSDGDGYGNPSFVIQLCQQPQNIVETQMTAMIRTILFIHWTYPFMQMTLKMMVSRRPRTLQWEMDLCENDFNGDMSPYR